MADLRRLRPRTGRGQVFVIGAIAIAVALVSLVVVLNSAVYTENVATRENDVVGDEGPVGYQSDVRRGIGRAVVTGNGQASSYPGRLNAVQGAVATLAGTWEQYHALDGRIATVSLVGQTQGVTVERTTDGSFAEPNGAESSDESWVVAGGPSTGPTRVRGFEMTVDRGSLVSAAGPTPADAFQVRLVDATGAAWTTYVFETGGATIVRTEFPSGTVSAPCTDASGTSTRIDVTGATVGGAHCEGLDVFERAGPPDDPDAAEQPLTVEFRSAENAADAPTATGRYRLTMAGATPPSTDYAYTGDDVVRRDVVYGVLARAVFRTSDVDYASEIRVAPGELDV